MAVPHKFFRAYSITAICFKMPPRASAHHLRLITAIIIMAVVVLIVIVGLAILFIWLVIKPKKLMYSIEEGSINFYNLTQGHLDSTFGLVVAAYNPNCRASVYYDSMEVMVSYGGLTVAFQVVQPFFQRHRNLTRLMVKPTARQVALPEKTARDMRLERTTGMVDVDVLVKGRIRLKVGVWKSWHYKLRVFALP
ncbi:hypothetical protein Nepgr_012949 [Nepenthes gracilis]|uniref:Late embryogenesis abundant protein LEA-2 subgroup domain-containing protein n=1 Tax=Nepenthes gracilis TaxID=150966 RepID=A0AAD3SGW3_NEPGR|nr:hypothetical protein Nepgr_012949 [Nepenthes gracilis]